MDGSDTTPNPGDTTICGHCGTALVVEGASESFTLRVATPEYLAALPEGERLGLAGAMIELALHRIRRG